MLNPQFSAYVGGKGPYWLVLIMVVSKSGAWRDI